MHGCGTVSILHVDVSMESTEVDNDILVGLGTGQMKSSPERKRKREREREREVLKRAKRGEAGKQLRVVSVQLRLTYAPCQRS